MKIRRNTTHVVLDRTVSLSDEDRQTINSVDDVLGCIAFDLDTVSELCENGFEAYFLKHLSARIKNERKNLLGLLR